MMKNEIDTLFRAVVPFMIWDPDIPYQEDEMPPVWRWGTSFFVQVDNNFYAVTAKHCLGKVDITHIFLALPNKKMRSIPISKVILSNYTDDVYTDTDVVLMKIPLLDTLISKAKPETDKLAQDILNTPYMKRQIRLNKRRTPQEAIKRIMDSSFYQQMRKYQEKDMLKLIDKAYTEDLRLCVLNLRKHHDMKKGDACVSLGIPNSDFNINYTQSTIRSVIVGINCKFICFDPVRQDYVFECDRVEELDGMSGGPIIFDNTVIAMQHSVNIKEKKIYATPITIDFIRKAEMA